ncbi:hypothetical protein GCM10023261_17390 [Bartonella jaculi]|uniref:Uncharacterized protein n=1 Tax=Bartonella jaculi TaxID=686226 RepID=A0ABP9NH03_9HYPH
MARIQVHVPDAIKHFSEEVIQSTGLHSLLVIYLYLCNNTYYE